MTPGDGSTAADKRAARAERAAEAKVREEREKDPAYQEKNRKEEEEKKTKEDYDKWRGSASKASTFQESIVASKQGWLWVFFGLGGRLNPKFPGGTPRQAERLADEGHGITANRKGEPARVEGWEARQFLFD